MSDDQVDPQHIKSRYPKSEASIGWALQQEFAKSVVRSRLSHAPGTMKSWSFKKFIGPIGQSKTLHSYIAVQYSSTSASSALSTTCIHSGLSPNDRHFTALSIDVDRSGAHVNPDRISCEIRLFVEYVLGIVRRT